MPRHRMAINLIYEYTIVLIYRSIWSSSLVSILVMHNIIVCFHPLDALNCMSVRV